MKGIREEVRGKKIGGGEAENEGWRSHQCTDRRLVNINIEPAKCEVVSEREQEKKIRGKLYVMG